MKLFLKIIASSLFVPLALFTVFMGTVKFEILNDKYVLNTFEKYKIYSNIQKEVNNYLDNKNANIFSKITTIENIKDFTNKNTISVIGFLNGSPDELTFYIPVSIIPSDLLPKKLGSLKESMTAKELIQKFNINGIDMNVVNKLNSVGYIVNILFYLFLLISLLLVIFIHEFALVLVGLILILQKYLLANVSLNINKIMNLFTKPILMEISNTWLVLGVIFVLVGIIITIYKYFTKNKKHGQI